MDLEPKEFFAKLRRFTNESQNTSECENILSNLNALLATEHLNESLIDSYLLYIFNENCGIPKFIASVVQHKTFKHAVIKALEILHTLLNNFPQKIEKHIKMIHNCCLTVASSAMASADEKVRSLDLLILSFEKIHNCIGDYEHYKQLYTSLYAILSIKNSDTIEEKIYMALGQFAKNYSFCVENLDQLRDVLINALHTAALKQKQSQRVICGLFTSLFHFCEIFPLEPEKDANKIEKIQMAIQYMAVPKTEGVKIANRAAFHFLTKYMDLFSKWVFVNCKKWHEIILKWFTYGKEEKKVAFELLLAFYQNLGKKLTEDAQKPNYKKIIKYFIEFCQNKISAPDVDTYERRCAIHGIRLLTQASYIILDSQEVRKISMDIIQTFENKYVLNENPSEEEWEFLPDYIQTVANFFRFKRHNPDELFCLQKGIVGMIKSFPQVPYSYHNSIVSAFIVTLHYLRGHEGNVFENFLESVIYQSVIWISSHRHISEAEMLGNPDKSVVTVKDYFPFWISLFKFVTSSDYAGITVSREDRSFIYTKIVDKLIRTLLSTVNRLEVSVSIKNCNSPTSDISHAYKVNKEDDYAIFLNLVDFYRQMLTKIDIEIFKHCIWKLINYFVTMCVTHPFVSGFYKLLAQCLIIANKLKFFDESQEMNQDQKLTYGTLREFIIMLLNNMKHYKDELLMSCLEVLLEYPVPVIKDVLPACKLPFFQIFSLGRTNLALARTGVRTLGYWQKKLPSEQMEPFLSEILPKLDTYLRTGTNDAILQAIPVERRRKTALSVKKRKVILEIQPELAELQWEILHLIGLQNTKLCQSFVFSSNNVESVWNSTQYLKVTLPYQTKLEICLEKFIPRVVSLALYCNDRKTRITACELLQAIVVVFLGRAKALNESSRNDLNHLLEKIAFPLLQLASDNDQVVVQLFEPLFMQIIHWYTRPQELKTAHSAIFIDAIMDGITHPSDSAIRDFSGKCLREFFKWSVKQSSEERIENDPAFLKILVNKMRFFSTHSDASKKLGAALIYSNIYHEFHREERLIKIFGLEILHIFITSLSQIHPCPQGGLENTIEKIQFAVSRIRDCLSFSADWTSKDASRRVPPEMGDGTVKDVAAWILLNIGSKSPYCRQASIELFNIVVKDGKEFITNYIGNISYKDSQLLHKFEEGLSKYPTLDSITKAESPQVLFDWLQELMCGLDVALFMSRKNLIDFNEVETSTLVALQYYVEKVATSNFESALALISTQKWYYTSFEKNHFNKLRGEIVIQLLKLLQYVSKGTNFSRKIFNKEMYQMLVYATFDPHLVGLTVALNERNKHFNILAESVNCIQTCGQESIAFEMEQVFLDYLKQNIIQTIDLKSPANLKSRNLLRGLLFLEGHGILRTYQLNLFWNGITPRLYQALKDCNGNIPQYTTTEYVTLLIELVLNNNAERPIMFEYLTSTKYVLDTEAGQISFASYIISNFDNSACLPILLKFKEFLTHPNNLDANATENANIIILLSEYLFNNRKKLKYLFETFLKDFCAWFSQFSNYFESSLENIELGLRLIKTTTPLSLGDRKVWNDLNNWLVHLLSYKGITQPVEEYEFKMRVVSILSETLDWGFAHEELRDGLLYIASNFFESSLIDDNAKFTSWFKLMNLLPKLENPMIFRFLIKSYWTQNFEQNTTEVAEFLPYYIKHLDQPLQVHSLATLLELLNNENLDILQKHSVIKSTLQHIFIGCDFEVFVKFYITNIKDIIQKLKQDTSPNNIASKIVQLMFVEFLFLRIPEGNNQAIIDAADAGPRLAVVFLKSTLEIVKEIPLVEHKDIFRLYKCYNYNTLVSIITSVKQKYLYVKLFTRIENDQDVLWSGLIDLEKQYHFPKTFDNLPKRRKTIIGIRDEVRMEKNISSVKYLESQRLFNSSLSEDVTKYDFAYAKPRSEPVDYTKKANDGNVLPSEVEMDEDDLNNHECMPVICALLNHMLGNEMFALPEDEGPVILSSWAVGLRDLLLKDNTHKNVKIFLIRLILNSSKIFTYYAKPFLEPLLKFLDDEIAGNDINYFVSEIIAILGQWSAKTIPQSKEEKALASRLLLFLFKKIDNDRRDIFKYHLELIKLLVESWKSVLTIPYELIASKISQVSSSQNWREIEVGIHLSAILLANGRLPCLESDLNPYFTYLIEILKTATKSIYKPCAETIGLLLHLLSNDETSLNVYKDKLTSFLRDIQDPEKYGHFLEAIVLHYPEFLSEYDIIRLLSRLTTCPVGLQIVYLKVILAANNSMENISDFKLQNWRHFIEHDNMDIQVITLEIINKNLNALSNTHSFILLMQSIVKLVQSQHTICRSRAYDIFITSAKVGYENVSNICKSALIDGLSDNNLELRNKIYDFWCEFEEVPDSISSRFAFVLSQMYKTNSEDSFLSYLSFLLLSRLEQSEDFEKKIFDHPLEDCDFEDYHLQTNWRIQNPSVVPMFADTLSSQSASDFYPRDNQFNYLRQTQGNATAAPTQSIKASQISQISQIVSLETSLVATPSYSGVSSAFINPNDVQISQKYRISRPFLKNRNRISQKFANIEIEKKVVKHENRLDMVKERERKVVIYRKYRTGDLPDVQIPLSAVLKPLQVLAQCDPEISKILCTEIFEKVLSTIEDKEAFLTSISLAIKNIFKKSTQFNTNFFRTLFDIILKGKKHIILEPSLISSVCLASGLISTGTLLLEEYLITYNDLPPACKKKNEFGDGTEVSYWVKLAELYKEMNEWDVVKSIFLNKMNCQESVKQALICESNKQWLEARNLYESLINNDNSYERKDFYYESYFKCFAHLGEWKHLPSAIEHVVETNDTNCLQALWDQGWNQQKLLPWYITAEVNNILFEQQPSPKFLIHLNEIIQNEVDKYYYLCGNFSEEMSMLSVRDKDFQTAKQNLKTHMETFLEKWQLLDPMFASLRYSKILKLRNIVDIDRFIWQHEHLNPMNANHLTGLLKLQWRASLDDELLPSITSFETKLLHQRQFIKLLEDKIRSFTDCGIEDEIRGLHSAKYDLNLRMIRVAIRENNFSIASKYWKEYESSSGSEYIIPACQTVCIKAKVSNDKEDALKYFMNAFVKLGTLETNDTKLFLSAQLLKFNILQDVSSIFNSSPEIFGKYNEAVSSFLHVPSVNRPEDLTELAAEYLRSVIQTHEQSVDQFTDMQENISKKDSCQQLAQIYATLAEYLRGAQKSHLPDFIFCVLRATKLQSSEARLLFPSLLEIDNLGSAYKDMFIKECSNIPTWMFLFWIPQLLTCVDSDKVLAVAPIIERVARTYPQAIMYAYKMSKDSYNLQGKDYKAEALALLERLDSLLYNEKLDIFLKALANVAMPHIILRYNLDKLITACSTGKMNVAETILNYILKDLFNGSPDSKNPDSFQGNMYKKMCTKDFKKDIATLRLSNKNVVDKIREIMAKVKLNFDELVKSRQLSKLLKDYCPWLSSFSAQQFGLDLEIPGQYSGHKMPLVQHHVKIGRFSPHVMVMSSIRRPIKIEIIGNDTKTYPFLIKFGEDLRQDQRIQQLFKFMNSHFSKDVKCSEQELSLLTYEVCPLTSSLGMIEWVEDTVTLHKLVEKSIKRNDADKYLEHLKEKYYSSLPGVSQKKLDFEIFGLAATKIGRDKAIAFYRSLVNEVEWDVFRTAFWSLSINTETFIAFRHNFMKSYGALCACHWILGVGDRHLGNLMVCLKSGRVLGIDFGHAFGTATQFLGVPELVPFRLTPHIVYFMEPMKEVGHFKEAMIHCLRVLRENKNPLLAVMGVFIREPSIDWLEFAAKSNSLDSAGWYPEEKIEQAKRKLEGANSSTIMIKELEGGPKYRNQYTSAYVNWVKGSGSYNVRARGLGDKMSVEDQVDCLIDHATDYNLLGRMFYGWAPWI